MAKSTRTDRAAGHCAGTGARAARSPAVSNLGLLRAAVLGLRLIGDDVELQAAIRPETRAGPNAGPKGRREGPSLGRPRHGVEDLVSQRRKLLRLYYDDKIGSELFAEEEAAPVRRHP